MVMYLCFILDCTWQLMTVQELLTLSNVKNIALEYVSIISGRSERLVIAQLSFVSISISPAAVGNGHPSTKQIPGC